MSDQVFGRGYADQYDLLYGDKDYEAECDLLEEVFRRYGDGDIHSILDLGCGTGNHAIPLARRGYHVTGVDLSSEMLAHAQRKAQANLQPASCTLPTFLQGDVRSIDLCQTFDVVLMMFAVLSYQLTNDDVAAALRTVRRHLRPGGLFVFNVWYGPAVLAIRPGDRVKVIPTPDGQLIRVASGRLDVRHHLCEVGYQLWRLGGDQVVSTSEECHCMRYFFPMELDYLLAQAHMKLEMLVAFPQIQREADESSWNVLGVARALVQQRAQDDRASQLSMVRQGSEMGRVDEALHQHPEMNPADAVSVTIIQPLRGWTSLRLHELWEYRELLYFRTWRDIKVRYKQTVLGAAWAIIQSFFTMVVFSLFFGKLAKMPSDDIPYPIFSYAALVPWTFFANGLSQSSTSLVASANLIKKVHFPRLVVSISAVLSGGG